MDLETNFVKRGQTDETTFLNNPYEFKLFHPKEYSGYDNPCYLKRVTSKVATLYDFMYFHIGEEYKMCFTKSLDQVEAKEDENRKKQEEVQLSFDYFDLNEGYSTREISLLDDCIQCYTEEELSRCSSDSSMI